MDHGLKTPFPFLASCIALSAACLITNTPAHAAEPAAEGSISASADPRGASLGANAGADDSGEATSWFRRHGPRRGSWELGLFGGLWIPSADIELYQPELDFAGYGRVAPDLGLRAGYYLLKHFGIEGELAFMPSGIEGGERSLVYSARAHGVVQLGIGRIVPFAVLGGGVLAVASDETAAGRNADQALIVGGGIKYYATRNLLVRLDVRDVMSPQVGLDVAAPSNNLEVLLGLSIALGPPPKAPPPPADRDGDGVVDPDDRCPDVAGEGPDGCPIPDTDGDGYLDPEDACPEVAGATPDGCPIPDTDGDGFLDPDDACPNEVGIEPNGCPVRDLDGDGLLAPEDQCPEEPETANGFEDADGCPDELPDVIKQFTGVIEGIYFDTAKSSIRDESFARLDEAAKVLLDYPSLRVKISGHTDNEGTQGYNVKLSQSRADSVKNYLVHKGIDASRIETHGAGPDEPIESNETRSGRSKNRRIEFKLLTE